MKCFTPEIAWHNRDPVLCVDIHVDKVSTSVYRLVSGGADTHIVIWYIKYDYSNDSKGISQIDYVTELNRHQKAVNVVKFSPSGEYLASGDDEPVILVWKKKTNEVTDSSDVKVIEGEEQWLCHKTLRLHLDDVYDISWCADSNHLISGSIDNTAILWNVTNGTKIAMFSEHRGFVQGVAADPLQKYLATLSSDRSLRIYSMANKNLVSHCNKAVIPRSKESTNTAVRIFHDDTLKTYFRRLCFSPDGFLLLVPSGVIELPSSSLQNGSSETSLKPTNGTFVFLRDNFTEPIMYLPSGDQYSVTVRCCPVLFKKRKSCSDDEKAIFDIPYRIVIAVATKRSVLFYDTEHAAPFAYVTDIHYTQLTDLSWSSDGLILIVSSTDGFCTFISFAEGELGERWQENNQDKKKYDQKTDIENESNVEME